MKRNMKSEGCFFDLPYHYHYQDGAVRKLVMKEKKQLIKESDELWLELSQLANFDDTAYDEELKKSIKKSLGLGSEDIANELRKNNISTTRLLAAVLKAVEPFSQMMVQLLSLYSNAGALSVSDMIISPQAASFVCP